MLTGTVDRLDNNLDLLNGDLDQQTLLAVFLNPQAYIGSGADLEEINGNIIRGLSRDVGNSIDEFIVNNVRTNLLGLPLDLAVLNLSRGRETGIPSLNQTRAQLYNNYRPRRPHALRELVRLCVEHQECGLDRELYRGLWHARHDYQSTHARWQARGGGSDRLRWSGSTPSTAWPS